ncbi:cyclic nucleotide-binding domain-containing protein [Candidatus Gracilibacteria bacterium]|nr:cyclic nucleotide-binding domain-containing protein [Candidatus Gracilibacteria bacterium]
MYELKIFNGIEKHIVEKILLESPIENFKEGEIVFKEGENSNGKGYVIKSGKVSININKVVVAELGAGEMFGEIALLREEERNATVIAISDLELIALTLNDLIEMVNHDENIINKQIMRRIEENIENNF